ncbi:family 47 glycoside hydrolase [Cryphonectria parasitica EP155]|uniref:alpha-1,2-Mannosidase n=1 Tax=Cryphonectria parasitica (strain ATCC 38755 / EP155) TaxID=660469 RepID=A0A9P4Y8W8_CRYP1|nr:family 47 glycoside hydrolase [Cryphonectria parasitica EP155]KAF3768668.1 family 47 glycoside hydrolase [Cryphonectria parasitica EP155]
MSVTAALLSLVVFPVVIGADHTSTHNPTAVTASHGPIIPSYSHAAATTTLSGVTTATVSSSVAASATAISNGTLPACKPVQYAFPAGTGGNATRAAAVKEGYLYAWDAYAEYAFGYDELQPLSETATNDWYGWGVTIVDGIDTAIVMNLTDVVAKQLSFISTVDFSTTSYGDVEVFDTNIRYLGGLLSSHDLLKSGLFPTASYDEADIDALLSQAVVLADKLAYSFDTPSGIASVDLNFISDTPVEGTYTVTATGVTYNSTNTASAGTFLLEWYRLSDLTGNATYRHLVDRGEYPLVHPSPAPVYPGLVGTQFDTTSGEMLNYAGGWHSTVDSFLEYLIKTYHYKVTNTTTFYKDFWLDAAASTASYLAVHPSGFPDLTFISELDDNGTLTDYMDDYSCFMGGNLLLGCKILGLDSLCDLGLAAADGCHQTYNTTLTGLGPIYWGWYDSATDEQPSEPDRDVDAATRAWAEEYGYFIEYGDEVYASFPESIESWFYAYRITGEQRWADYVWDAFLAINSTARNSVAFATVNNVNMPFGGSQSNNLDSFFFAEVLKYIYLTFEDPNVVNLDQFVFNTESHPVLVQCGIGDIDNY